MRELFGPTNKWGYTAAVDVPIFNLWEALADEFPDAKVILVLRDDQSWVKAVSNHLKVSLLPNKTFTRVQVRAA